MVLVVMVVLYSVILLCDTTRICFDVAHSLCVLWQRHISLPLLAVKNSFEKSSDVMHEINNRSIISEQVDKQCLP